MGCVEGSRERKGGRMKEEEEERKKKKGVPGLF